MEHFNTHAQSFVGRRLAVPLSFAAAALCWAGCSDDDADPPEFSGTWRTSCTAQEDDGQTSYTISEIGERAGIPRFTVTVFSDAACQTPFFSIGNESNRTLGNPVATVPGAFELDVLFTRLFATPHADAAVGFLTSAGCGTSPATDREGDVSATGCLFFSPISECAGDYDIVKIDGNRAYNGVRGGNMCVPAGRPTALNAFFFTKVGS